MSIYFFDTSALQHRYVSGSSVCRGVRRIVSDSRNQCYVSEISVLEIASGIGNRCRKNNWTLRQFDKMDSAFVADVAAGRLQVVPASQIQLLKARHLIRYAGMVQKRKITSADALIASAALELAIERAPREVTFCLDDRKLFDILSHINAFTSAIRFRYLGSPTT